MESTALINDTITQGEKKLERQIETCPHVEELAIFCPAHDIALCNDCYFANHD